MKKLFPGSFEPGLEDFRSHWNDCVFILDPSVFLSLYRKDSKSVQQTIDFLQVLSPKIWIPYQAAKTYLDSRERIIAEEIRECHEFKSALNQELQSFKRCIEDSRNPILMNVNDSFKNIQEAVDLFHEQLAENMEEHFSFESDAILEQLSEVIIQDRVGASLNYEEISGIEKESKMREELLMPPFPEHQEEGLKQFTSLVLWKQIMYHVKKERIPAVFITDGHPSSWWKTIDADMYSVRSELINELNNDLKVFFQIVELQRFKGFADQILTEIHDTETLVLEFSRKDA